MDFRDRNNIIGAFFGQLDRWNNSRQGKSGKFLPLSFFVSSILVSLIPILAKNTDFITNSSDSILKLNLFLSVYLFLLPSLAIGLIQPIILKEYADDFSKIGSRYGTLSAVWSIGSVLGVFLTGFFFISNIGSMETIWLISIILFFLIGLIFSIGNMKVLLFFSSGCYCCSNNFIFSPRKS